MENNKKIFWITTQFPEGEKNRSGMFIYRTINVLSKYYPIIVICLYHSTPPIFSIFKRFKNYKEIFNEWRKLRSAEPTKPNYIDDSYEVIYVKYFRPPRGRFSFSEGYFAFRAIKKKVNKQLKLGNILLHANWLLPEGKAAELLSKKFSFPYIITLRGDEVDNLKVGSFNYKSIESILKNSKKVASVSHELFKVCESKNLYIKSDKRILTHNFYEVDKFIIKDKKEARKFVGVNDKSKILFFAGGLNKGKNVDVLIKSVGELIKESHALQLYIAGSGYEKNFLQDIANERKISDRIIFIGNLQPEELIEYYNAADLFCLVSKHEGLPNVVVESLLCGTPVIASSVAEIPFLIKEGINGFLVEPNSINSLCDKIKKGLVNYWDRNIIRESMKFLFPDNVLNEYRKLYNEFGLSIKKTE